MIFNECWVIVSGLALNACIAAFRPVPRASTPPIIIAPVLLAANFFIAPFIPPDAADFAQFLVKNNS